MLPNNSRKSCHVLQILFSFSAVSFNFSFDLLEPISSIPFNSPNVTEQLLCRGHAARFQWYTQDKGTYLYPKIQTYKNRNLLPPISRARDPLPPCPATTFLASAANCTSSGLHHLLAGPLPAPQYVTTLTSWNVSSLASSSWDLSARSAWGCFYPQREVGKPEVN